VFVFVCVCYIIILLLAIAPRSRLSASWNCASTCITRTLPRCRTMTLLSRERKITIIIKKDRKKERMNETQWKKEKKKKKTLSSDASALHFWHDRHRRCRAHCVTFLRATEPGKSWELRIVITIIFITFIIHRVQLQMDWSPIVWLRESKCLLRWVYGVLKNYNFVCHNVNDEDVINLFCQRCW